MQPRSLHGVQLLNYVECDHLPAVSLLGWHHGSGERKGRARPSRAGPSRPALSRAPSPARPPSQRQTAISSRSREAAGCGSPLGPPGLQATQLPPQSTAAQCGTPCPSRVGPPPRRYLPPPPPAGPAPLLLPAPRPGSPPAAGRGERPLGPPRLGRAAVTQGQSPPPRPAVSSRRKHGGAPIPPLPRRGRCPLSSSK